jgi:[ribosomal protein S5]-alanine N-acetyltransferase
MNIQLERCTLRAWREGDQAELVRQANNPQVAMNLRDLFPQPYTARDADEWMARAARQVAGVHFAITVEDQVAGGIGLLPGSDVNRIQAEIGYWLGQAWWGRGIATDAVRGLTRHAFATLALNRLFATPFAPNLASCRVLEKAGYRCEGRMLGCAIKGGKILDQFLYAITRSEITDL